MDKIVGKIRDFGQTKNDIVDDTFVASLNTVQ